MRAHGRKVVLKNELELSFMLCGSMRDFEKGISMLDNTCLVIPGVP